LQIYFWKALLATSTWPLSAAEPDDLCETSETSNYLEKKRICTGARPKTAQVQRRTARLRDVGGRRELTREVVPPLREVFTPVRDVVTTLRKQLYDENGEHTIAILQLTFSQVHELTHATATKQS
jgi:hypothetical protein